MDMLMDNLILQGCVTARLSFPLARLFSNQNWTWQSSTVKTQHTQLSSECLGIMKVIAIVMMMIKKEGQKVGDMEWMRMHHKTPLMRELTNVGEVISSPGIGIILLCHVYNVRWHIVNDHRWFYILVLHINVWNILFIGRKSLSSDQHAGISLLDHNWKYLKVS